MTTDGTGDLIDITVPVRAGMVTFPGDPPYRSGLVRSLAAGDVCDLTRAEGGVHTGTHIDAPRHFVVGGAAVDDVPLGACVGPAYVVDARGVTGHIDAAVLDRLVLPPDAVRVLFLTSNSARWADDAFAEDFVALTPDAADELVRRGAVLVGNDYLSVAPYDDPAPTHVTRSPPASSSSRAWTCAASSPAGTT